MPKLYIVATPIGNLKDITLRALEVLRSVDIILAEDTRVTRKLLSHYEIRKQVLRYLPQKNYSRFESIALMTDAGTPSISDPGLGLVRDLTKSGFSIIPVPGASALTAMISVSDIDLKAFCFLGFPPRKKGRQGFFKRITNLPDGLSADKAGKAGNELPVILFESPHRIQKTLGELEKYCGDRHANIGRELTKIYEEVFRGKVSEAQRHFTGERQRGEFVIVLDSK